MSEKTFNINMKKITAVLCAIVALLSVVFFFAGKPGLRIKLLGEQIENTKDYITQQQESIAQWEEDIANAQATLQGYQADLVKAQKAMTDATAAKANAEKELKQCEEDLDEVCYRSYYSSYYCKSTCRSLHSAVEAAEVAVEIAAEELNDCRNKVQSIQDNISTMEQAIEQCERYIENANDRIDRLNEELKELKKERTNAWLMLLMRLAALLLLVAGLGILTHRFFTNTEDIFRLYAFGGIALSSLLFLLANWIATSHNILLLLLQPNFWSIVVMTLFAAILTKEDMDRTKLRLFAVISSVILCALGIVTKNFVVPYLYAATLICIAFILVPLDFKEYISIAKHIFLSVITLGIWQLVWIYFVTRNLNRVAEAENRNPSWELLMCFLLPLYYLYWLLKTAENTELYGKENGKEFSIHVLCIAFGLINPLFASVLIQNKINVIVGRPEE